MYVKLCLIIHSECQSKNKLPCGVSFKQILMEKCSKIFQQNSKIGKKKIKTVS